jgi:DNA helicase HerA-like ATPase
MTAELPVARNSTSLLSLLPALANRHGLITGATGTGKSVTLQTLAQGFSRIGVPVFLADVKGDLAGISRPGTTSAKMAAVLAERGIEVPAPAACPTVFWDVFGTQGHPVRATVSDMGPLLLGRMLGLNDTQSGVLDIVFKVADDRGLLLLDMKDLRALLQHVGENAAEFRTAYGNVSPASIGAIQRGLLQIEAQGGDRFFGEPMLSIDDLLQTDPVTGHGNINLLAADRLLQSPRLYATFLLWLLSELFEHLPEIGDPEKPKLVFFFDEAHLLFDEAPPALVSRIELVVRLVRSKGVGIYFATQNPLDVPDSVLAQLGNRLQHALRAFTPRDQKAVRAVAETMRPNPGLDIRAAIGELATGEALLSLLDEKGRPSPTERAFVIPPASRLGPVTPAERAETMQASPVAGAYETAIDRESAYEVLGGHAAASSAPSTRVPPVPASASEPGSPAPGSPAPQAPAGGGLMDSLNELVFGRTGPRGGQHDGLAQTAARAAIRTIGSSVGREIVRGVLGSLLGGRSRR